MLISPGWHPIVVHFPLAMVATGAACLTLARFKLPRQHADAVAVVGTWNLCMGAAAILLALGSGLAAVMDLHLSAAAHLAVSAHVKSAFLTTLLVFAVGLWRGLGVSPASRPSWLFVILLWAATMSLVVTGYRGGQNVYRYGIGVSAAP